MTALTIYATVLYAAMYIGEYFLAKMPIAWPGLVLPIITFCMAMMNVIAYAGAGYGNIITIFIQSNINTIFLLLLYFFVRRTKK